MAVTATEWSASRWARRNLCKAKLFSHLPSLLNWEFAFTGWVGRSGWGKGVREDGVGGGGRKMKRKEGENYKREGWRKRKNKEVCVYVSVCVWEWKKETALGLGDPVRRGRRWKTGGTASRERERGRKNKGGRLIKSIGCQWYKRASFRKVHNNYNILVLIWQRCVQSVCKEGVCFSAQTDKLSRYMRLLLFLLATRLLQHLLYILALQQYFAHIRFSTSSLVSPGADVCHSPFVCLSPNLPACQSVSLPVCLSVPLSAYLLACLPRWVPPCLLINCLPASLSAYLPTCYSHHA